MTKVVHIVVLEICQNGWNVSWWSWKEGKLKSIVTRLFVLLLLQFIPARSYA